MDFTEFLTDNLVWIIIGAAFIVILAVLIIVLVVGSKRKKRRLEEEDAETVYDATPVSEAPVCETQTEAWEADAASAAADAADKPAASDRPAAQDAPAKQAEAAAPAAEPIVTEMSAPEPTPAADTVPAPATVRVVPKKAAAPAKKAKRPTGKWIIEHKGAGEYAAKLCASNGEVMLTSEAYSSENGARTGIGTIIKATETGEFVIYRDKNGNFYYKLKSANNRLLCVGEIYKAKDQCEKAVESIKRIAADAIVIDDVAEGSKYVEYKPAELNEDEFRRGVRGKWRVEPTEDGRFSAKLYANNGQLMLATEEVSTLKRATDAIEIVKRNAAQGNFIIDRDKFGRYYYKLRNAQRSVICIGEAYDKLDSCVSAIESVRRFAATSE